MTKFNTPVRAFRVTARMVLVDDQVYALIATT
jgi:hypothetical protein